MIRVQMVSRGIPAYQNDFADKDEALKSAHILANGCKAAVQQDDPASLINFALKGGFIRAFQLSA